MTNVCVSFFSYVCNVNLYFTRMRYAKAFILVYVLWLLLGTVSKVVFLLIHHETIGACDMGDLLGVLGHGVKLDMAIAGYLTVLPALILLMGEWLEGKYILPLWRLLFVFLSFGTALFYSVNIGLYAYWGFPLDSTPLLYLKTSPTDTMASMTMWEIVYRCMIIIVSSVLTYLLFEYILVPKQLFGGRKRVPVRRKIITTTFLLIMTALLILPIRGGLGTGTNHTGTVYFSQNIRLNHAAVNPIFSFVESVLHKVDIGSQFRFMDDNEANRIFDGMVYTQLRKDNDSLKFITKPNVIVIMLESFSKYIMSEGGHLTGVTPNLDSIKKEGWYFDQFYANTVRTDRAIVSILSGLPAQPSMSIMDMPNKSTQLPSIARSLRSNGYTTSFYYGGDTNYSNMQSYVVGTGYQNVVSDKSFPSSQITSKWGVHDGIVFDRILKDIDEMGKNNPFFVTMMTLSSHEPFDVPYKSQFAHEALNAFAYTDHELGRFMDSLKTKPLWKNTLVVIVPDHLGAYPDNIDNYQMWRYEIPLVMTGGIIKEPQSIHAIGSQNDIAATILGLLNIDHSDFAFSKDLLDSRAPHFAFLAFPDASFGMITERNQILYDGIPNSVILDRGEKRGENLSKAKAYLQKLYDYIDGL